MSEAKSKRRRRDKNDEEAGFSRGSGVDYSKVADRHVDDDRYELHKKTPPALGAAPDAARIATSAEATSQSPAISGGGKVSSQMEAVMRVMAGMQERTIAEKLADSNRPTWEQYKKDNEDKLNISGLDQKKMEEYRKELDAQRDKILSRGLNHRDDKKKGDASSNGEKKRKGHRKKRLRHGEYSQKGDDSSDDYSTEEDRHKKKHKKKHKKRHKKHKRHRRCSSGSERSDYSSDSEEDNRKRKKHKKKKKEKKRDKERKSDGDGSGDDAYRLSSFFNS